LMMTGVTNWVIKDEGPSWDSLDHEFTVSVQCDGGRIIE